jgi:hypothetical protein
MRQYTNFLEKSLLAPGEEKKKKKGLLSPLMLEKRVEKNLNKRI